MAMIMGLLLSGFILYGCYRLMVSRAARLKFGADFRREPFFTIFAFSGVLCILGFMWGVIIQPVGMLHIVGGYNLAQISGAGAIIWLASYFIVQAVGDYRHSRRRKLSSRQSPPPPPTDQPQ
jgi:hypothetical protein